jgi:small subunit ribosomal protein S4
MARYLGPKTKISRRFGINLGGSGRALERKGYPPGMHGARGARRKKSDYAIALGEKQKLRFQYGLMERQFRRYFKKALSQRGITGETLLQLLETRLDNVVYRMGFANTRDASRQMVGHGHILVNGQKVTVPSYEVKPGDTVVVKDTPRSRQLAMRYMELTQINKEPDWMTVERDQFQGKIARVPTREDIDPVANEQLVVELYSR